MSISEHINEQLLQFLRDIKRSNNNNNNDLKIRLNFFLMLWKIHTWIVWHSDWWGIADHHRLLVYCFLCSYYSLVLWFFSSSSWRHYGKANKKKSHSFDKGNLKQSQMQELISHAKVVGQKKYAPAMFLLTFNHFA